MLLAALAVLAISAAATLGSTSGQRYAALLRGCARSHAQPYLECVNSAVLEYSSRRPSATGALLSYVFDHARDDGRRLDIRPLSDTAHYAGMELSIRSVSLRQGLIDCGYAFKAACMHGFVMERLDRAPLPRDRPEQRLLSFCLPVESTGGMYRNCLHGVGHELWARTRTSLNDTLALCDPLDGAGDRSACWSGVLMEYSKGDPVKGRHSHAPAGKRELPCTTLAPRFRQVCTYADASYRQYIPGWEPPRTTYERCAAAPSAERMRCMMLVSERLLIAESGRPGLAESTCAELHSGRATCYRSVSRLTR